MLIPKQWNLTLFPGFNFDPLFEFYDDDAHAEASDLTGYTAQLVIGSGRLVLTSAGGQLVLGGAAGTVQVLCPPALNENLPPGTLPWYLEWTPPGGQPDCPLAGQILVSTPSP
ncbi:MAG TPA: hypothetical protein VG275_06900 [Solirubrobacteraceae bacterium]|jgi:hypothetical protein|nr:hypothetical protein [Solirubrobacteraceae bacterium]